MSNFGGTFCQHNSTGGGFLILKLNILKLWAYSGTCGVKDSDILKVSHIL
jgi:hypothetical protein